MQHTRARRGRPATGRSPILTLALPAVMLATIDALAADEFVARAVIVRELLQRGLVGYGEREPAQGRGATGPHHG